MNLSVSADRDSACAAARRQATLIVSQQPPENLHRVGFEPSDYAATRAALKAGDGVDAAADLLPQEVADQLVVSGTPGDCIEALAELLGYAEDAGFTEATSVPRSARTPARRSSCSPPRSCRSSDERE